VKTYDITPEELGISSVPLGAVKGGDAVENAQIIRRVLGGERSPYRDIVLLNAGACIYVSDLAPTLKEGVRVAAEMIDSGKAEQKLRQWIAVTGELRHVS